MNFREAVVDDIEQIQKVRNSVKENMLSDPSVVSDVDCVLYLTKRGKGWVCEVNKLIVGFCIVDLKDHNVWALFVNPSFEGKGIGKQLQKIMLDWYFGKTNNTLGLGTGPNTRAESFYRISGWEEAGVHGKEIKFEMSKKHWQRIFKK